MVWMVKVDERVSEGGLGEFEILIEDIGVDPVAETSVITDIIGVIGN